MNNKYNNILIKEFLHKEYIVNKKSSIDISKEIGCDKGTILNNLKRFNIGRRTISKALKGKKQLIESNLKRSKTLLKVMPKGKNHWAYGIPLSKEHRKNVSNAMKGMIKSPEHLKNQAESLRKRKGGITSLHIIIRKCKKYIFWRDAVYKRDNYTCQECDHRGGNLEAHHIKSFSKILNKFVRKNKLSPIKDTYELYRLALAYDNFWDINNGQTLCADCHNITKRTQTCKNIKQGKQ